MVLKQMPEELREKIMKLREEEKYFEGVKDFDQWKKETLDHFFFVISEEAASIRYQMNKERKGSKEQMHAKVNTLLNKFSDKKNKDD